MIDFISNFLDVIRRLVPHLLLVRATEAGVLFKRGKTIKPIGPGLHWYWPLVTEYYTTAVVRQTQNLPIQSVVTRDRVAVAISGIIVYRIKDAVAALARTFDFNDTLKDIAMTAIVPYVCSRDYDVIITEIQNGTAQETLTKLVRRALRKYGVAVTAVGLTDFTEALALNHLWQPTQEPSGTTSLIASTT